MAWPLLRAGALEDLATSDLVVGPWEFDLVVDGRSVGVTPALGVKWINNRSLVMFYSPDSRPSLHEKVSHKELERSPHNTGKKSRP